VANATVVGSARPSRQSGQPGMPLLSVLALCCVYLAPTSTTKSGDLRMRRISRLAAAAAAATTDDELPPQQQPAAGYQVMLARAWPSKNDDSDASACPCASSSLCNSLPLGAAKDANTSIPRVFAFHPARAIYNGSDNEWMDWDWKAITTVATVAFCPDKYCDYPIAYHPGVVDKPNVSKALLCHAHQHGVRMHSFTYWNWNQPGTWSQLRNVTARKSWVDWQVGTVQRLGLDGVNVRSPTNEPPCLCFPVISLCFRSP
jgi:hypothetical protein